MTVTREQMLELVRPLNFWRLTAEDEKVLEAVRALIENAPAPHAVEEVSGLDDLLADLENVRVWNLLPEGWDAPDGFSEACNNAEGTLERIEAILKDPAATPKVSKERVEELREFLAWGGDGGQFLDAEERTDLLAILDEYALQSAPETKDVGQAAPSDEDRKEMLRAWDTFKLTMSREDWVCLCDVWNKIRAILLGEKR